VADAVQTVDDQLKTDPADSKKYRMVSRGMYYIMSLFTVSGLICWLIPAAASNIVTLAQTCVTAVGGLVAVYAGAQAAVEFKANSVLQANQTSNTTSQSNTSNNEPPCPTGPTGPAPVVQGASGAPAQPPFTPAAVVP
jgi:hypothetical protein